MPHHTHEVRLSKISKLDNSKFWQVRGSAGTLVCWRECKMGQLLWETLFKGLNIKLRLWPNNSSVWHIPQRTENLRPHKNVYIHVHSSIGRDSPNLETTQMSIRWETDKPNAVYPHNRILFSQTLEWSTDQCYNTGEPRKHVKWKKPDTGCHMLHDSIYIKFLE